VRLVHQEGKRVPPCVDSSNIGVLLAGLEEWFGFDGARPPLVNSMTYHAMDKYGPILDLRRSHVFGVICLLSGPEGVLKSPGEVHRAALPLGTSSSTRLRWR